MDVNGKVLATSNVVNIPMIPDGTGIFQDFDLAKALTGTQRLQFHVSVRTSAEHPGYATGEVIDKLTGKTQFTFQPEIILDPTRVPIIQ